MLSQLRFRHGAEFTIDGACDALDMLIQVAQLAKRELRAKKAEQP